MKSIFTNVEKYSSLFFVSGLFLLSSCSDPNAPTDTVSISNDPKNSTQKNIIEEIQWIKIPGGEYLMGSPEGQGYRDEYPQHKEEVQTLYVMQKEVTVQQFKQCVHDRVCWETLDMNPDYCNYINKEKANHPINCIDWNQANVFCTWADSRLPTEVEWEYFASDGGRNIKYPWGNEPASCRYANMDTKDGKACGTWSTWEGCSQPAGNNQFGICDLAGNVFEWTSDWYHPDYNKGRRDEERPPKLPVYNSREKVYHRVARGGGIGSDSPNLIRKRSRFPVDSHFAGLGIRCVR